MIVATLLEPRLADLRTAIRTLDGTADAFEVRFDACRESVRPAAARALTDKTLVGTVRRPSDGGRYRGEESKRLAILEECLAAGFEHVDIEGSLALPAPPERLIRSHHDFRRTPPLPLILRLAKPSGREGSLFKFAAKTNSFRDVLTLLRAAGRLRNEGTRFAIMGLGPFPRALTHLLGSELLYGGGRTNAPGQPSARELRSTLAHWGAPTPAERLFLVVGDPIVHSLSPRMHNAAFRARRRTAAFGALEVSNANELRGLLATAPDLGLQGLSVTTPLKDAAFRLCPSRTPQAVAAQAVNCIRFRDGIPEGTNTDGLGARAIVERLVARRNGSVLLLGTGGAARAILSELAAFDVTVAGRSPTRTARVARRFHRAHVRLQDATRRQREFDLLINATRIEDPIRLSEFEGHLFDLHYAAQPTAWQRYATRHRRPFAGGRELLVEQGRLAYEFWTGDVAPDDVMRNAAEAGP